MLTPEKIETISQSLHLWRKLVDDITLTVSRNLMSLLLLCGTIFVPFLPASLTGVSVYYSLTDVWGSSVAMLVGLTAGIFLEAIGIAGADASLKVYQDWRKDSDARRYEFFTTLVVVVAYVLMVASVIGFLHELPDGIYQFGIVSPLGVVLFYIARGLLFMSEERERQNREIEATRQALEQQRKLADLRDYEATLEQERQLKRLEAEQNLELKRRKSEQKLETQTAKIGTNGGRVDRAKARQLIDQNPHISGAELGRQLGVTERTGRNLKAELAGNHNGKMPSP